MCLQSCLLWARLMERCFLLAESVYLLGPNPGAELGFPGVGDWGVITRFCLFFKIKRHEIEKIQILRCAFLDPSIKYIDVVYLMSGNNKVGILLWMTTSQSHYYDVIKGNPAQTSKYSAMLKLSSFKVYISKVFHVAKLNLFSPKTNWDVTPAEL